MDVYPNRSSPTISAEEAIFHSRLREKVELVEDIQPASEAPPRNLVENQAEPKEITVSHELAARCRALVLFVSTPILVPEVKGYVQENDPTSNDPEPPPPPDPVAPRPESPHVVLKDGDKQCDLAGSPATLGLDINAITSSRIYWNWQQLLRALRGMSQLEVVYLLGSPDSATYKPEPVNSEGRRPEFQPGFKQKPGSGKGSYDYLGLCRAFLIPYLPSIPFERTPAIIPWAKPVDFENFNALTKELRVITASLRSGGLEASQILVDVTGGQKVTSIAGAVLTVSNELRFQYVQTNAPFDSVPYDLVRRATPNIEPHVSG